MAGGSVVGLDIGSSAMKVAELKRSGNGVEVTALGTAPTPQDAFENSVVVDPQLLGQEVKKLLLQSGVTAKQVISAVSGQSSVVVRVIEVPQMTDAELAETMKWEVDKHIPFSINDSIVEYVPIERPGGYAEGENMDVLLAVAQQDMIDRHVAMLQAAGLKPNAIEVEPLAFGRTMLEVARNGTPPGYTVVIVNIGASITDIGIFRDKLLSFSRTLPLAGDNLTRAIAEAFQVDMETAENYKREHGEVMTGPTAQAVPEFGIPGDDGSGFMDFTTPPPPAPAPQQTGSPSGRMPFDFSTPEDVPPTPTPSPFEPSPGAVDLTGQPVPNTAPAPDFAAPDVNTPPAPSNLPVPAAGDPATETLRAQIFNAIAPILAELAQEVRRSLDYYRGKSPDARVDEVMLIGGTARLRNLAAFMERELGVPAHVGDPLHNIPVSSKNFSPGHLAEISPLFPISIGLGVRDLVAPAPAKKTKRK